MATEIEGPADVKTASSSVKELCNALYASCASQAADKVFNQQELLSLNVIPENDLKELVSCLQRLTKNGLFKIMTKDGKPCWKVVKKEDAAKYQHFNMEEALVYSYIESSGREGIWTRTIRHRTNLHQVVMNRSLKTLESKGFIKPIQSAKFPKRKIYIVGSLQPSDDVTGGPFYTDGILDEEFVHQMGLWAERYIQAKSWYQPAKPSQKAKKKPKILSSEEDNTVRRQESKEAEKEQHKVMLPMPPGYTGYPTIPEITKAVNQSGLSGVVMKEAEMRQLIDVLCWDGRVMKVMDGMGYKSVRTLRLDDDDGPWNGLTEAPCGRCPVFDLCEEGGPVNARTCSYFQDWLAI